ncbi:hypothetical protein PPERSA_11642 [Pseudocohnilembus persalinus]|uniref:P-loop containing nucleoside triphosphate hydrolase n=1 Tax=Pseudocohnilembus persalinus TaxID=266149 RepID=A0A0V0QA35_PSEPJ|nr:hypothetical protein PPERSA_11642 [Pseudocohnilembus persalinus]|eukprot:KRW99041.1 hypothetical protein PPERSA_11642 [Pseudocohnilembus persalinus]
MDENDTYEDLVDEISINYESKLNQNTTEQFGDVTQEKLQNSLHSLRLKSTSSFQSAFGQNRIEEVNYQEIINPNIKLKCFIFHNQISKIEDGPKIIGFSGPSQVGKTMISEIIQYNFQAEYLQSNQYLKSEFAEKEMNGNIDHQKCYDWDKMLKDIKILCNQTKLPLIVIE